MIVRERGYVIFGSDDDYLPNAVIKAFLDRNGDLVGQPFRIVGSV
jgi:hypothetical protein